VIRGPGAGDAALPLSLRHEQCPRLIDFSEGSIPDNQLAKIVE